MRRTGDLEALCEHRDQLYPSYCGVVSAAQALRAVLAELSNILYHY